MAGTEQAEATREWEEDIRAFFDASIPGAVRSRAVSLIADGLSAAVAGSALETTRDVATNAPFADGSSSVLGTTRRLDAGQAALVNASSSVSQEVEGGLNPGTHLRAGISTAGFAVAEERDADGATLVDGFVKAFEVGARLEEALMVLRNELMDASGLDLRDPHENVWTPVGPALAAGYCMGMDAAELREVMRLAVNVAVISPFDPFFDGPGSLSRNYTGGLRVQTGVEIARLADDGLRGAGTALDAVFGPIREEMGEEFDALFADFGEEWHVDRSYFKPQPGCRLTHPALDAVKDAEADVDVDEIESIDVYTFSFAAGLVDGRHPEEFTQALFSAPYVVARYLHSGEVTLGHFDGESVRDPAVQTLAGKVAMHVDPEYEAGFWDRWGARVEVTHADGRVATGAVDHPLGMAKNPVDEPTLHGQFRANLARGIGEERAGPALDALVDLPDRDARAVGDLLRGA